MSDILFEPGIVLATATALQAMQYNEVTPQRMLGRHLRGDWGDLSDHGRQHNEQKILAGQGTVRSRYRLDDGELLLVTTSFGKGRTIISQPGDDEEIERCAAGWQGALRDAVPPAVARFLVLIPSETSAA